MKRTRKWAYVAQEATRLADLGLSPLEIATRLDVRRSTVQRWMAAGKVTDTRRSARRARGVPAVPSSAVWAAAVRSTYALDASDEELVTLGAAALRIAHDELEKPAVRLNAMGRFVVIVKQLALTPVADAVPEPAPMPEKPTPPPIIRRPGADPRTFLQAVK